MKKNAIVVEALNGVILNVALIRSFLGMLKTKMRWEMRSLGKCREREQTTNEGQITLHSNYLQQVFGAVCSRQQRFPEPVNNLLLYALESLFHFWD